MYAYAEHELTHLRARLAETLQRISPELREPNQALGTKRTIGCVAVEVTQRCNLDCSICYLSENSQSTPDLPLDRILRRLDRVREQYGVGTNVQLTGGDPTLRDPDELERIVRHAVALKLVPALFTNGVHASRPLLQRLSEAGLIDVAFHVDLTLKHKGYTREVQLHEIRSDYVERVRGLGLNVIFNQTIFKRNFDEVEELVGFYRRNADVVGMASFQLQADTGRGRNRKRRGPIHLQSVSERIESALGTELSWENVLFGHPKCHKLGYALVCGPNGEHVLDLFDDREALIQMLQVFDDVYLDRSRPARAAVQAVRAAVDRRWVRPGLRYWGGRALRHRRELLASRGRLRKLSFFVQNFQDAADLDHERIDNCSFHCMTDDGGVSMCVHNAYRDHYLQGGTGYPEAYQALREADGYRRDGHGRALRCAAK